MHGNVFEWCLDWKGALPYGTDPVGAASGALRVRCGGSWRNYATRCGSAYRDYYNPSNSDSHIGFRLCCSAEQR